MAREERIYKFRLYIAGDAQNSLEALANLHSLCDRFLVEHHEIEIVDVFAHPKRALEDGVFMTPALLKLSPLPTRRIIGTLSQTRTVLQALGLMDTASA